MGANKRPVFLERARPPLESTYSLMWSKNTKRDLDQAALDVTPNDGVNLSGRWTACYRQGVGDVLSGVQVQQYGTAVFGTMQCKVAAAAPIKIRGIVVGERLIANYWRPHEEGMGSGMFDLRISQDGRRLNGIGSWCDADTGTQKSFDYQWEKCSKK